MTLTSAGTVRDSHAVPSYPSVRRTKGNLRKDKGPQNPEQFKAPGTEVFNILCKIPPVFPRIALSLRRKRQLRLMIRKISYTCRGTCSRQIDVELENGVVRSVSFPGGCHGNQQGIAALVRGMTAAEAVARLEGIDCRGRGTSCPDQLAKALKKAL